jgi:hypothetical protein
MYHSMKRTTVLVSLALAWCTGAAAAADVPCNVFAQGNCPSPIVQGVADGQWIALIYHYNGTNGGPIGIGVVTVGAGGNGYLTTTLQTIEPADGGDRMDAQFVGGKLWIRNSIYLPSEAHCCNTHVVVRQYGFHQKRLHVERTATVAAAATRAEIAAALRAAKPSP